MEYANFNDIIFRISFNWYIEYLNEIDRTQVRIQYLVMFIQNLVIYVQYLKMYVQYFVMYFGIVMNVQYHMMHVQYLVMYMLQSCDVFSLIKNDESIRSRRWRSGLERSPRKRKVGCSNLSRDKTGCDRSTAKRSAIGASVLFRTNESRNHT